MQSDQRYRLSFTVGGLLAPQGHSIATLIMQDSDLAEGITPATELGERAVHVRRQAIDENVLAIRTQAANSRMVSEVLKRLSALTGTELRHLADRDTPAADRQALMWVAMCRYYAIVGEFADEVLRDRYLLGQPTVTYEDYDRFMLAKAMWHPELETLSTATAAKLRSNLFKAMFEAGLVEKDGNMLQPSLLSAAVTGILEDRPESFRYFPIREH
ncbi:DUF1819 family protein [Bifidobacterium leontopitheci]|nr:DUF1819 family protein [Bifidobacterium leontopitheci]